MLQLGQPVYLQVYVLELSVCEDIEPAWELEVNLVFEGGELLMIEDIINGYNFGSVFLGVVGIFEYVFMPFYAIWIGYKRDFRMAHYEFVIL